MIQNISHTGLHEYFEYLISKAVSYGILDQGDVKKIFAENPNLLGSPILPVFIEKGWIANKDEFILASNALREKIDAIFDAEGPLFEKLFKRHLVKRYYKFMILGLEKAFLNPEEFSQWFDNLNQRIKNKEYFKSSCLQRETSKLRCHRFENYRAQADRNDTALENPVDDGRRAFFIDED